MPDKETQEVIYPERSMWRSRNEKMVFSAMTIYICLCFAYILQYYTWGGQ